MFTVYSKDNCAYCTRAIRLLTEKNYQFTVKKIGTDVTRDWILENFPTMRTVPIIVSEVDGQKLLVGGYEQLEKSING